MEMVNLVIDEIDEKMAKAVEATRREFNSIRTGRATPALLDRITVESRRQTPGLALPSPWRRQSGRTRAAERPILKLL